jgi:hypothetical protein
MKLNEIHVKLDKEIVHMHVRKDSYTGFLSMLGDEIG